MLKSSRIFITIIKKEFCMSKSKPQTIPSQLLKAIAAGIKETISTPDFQRTREIEIAGIIK